jgi:hypothetical protein
MPSTAKPITCPVAITTQATMIMSARLFWHRLGPRSTLLQSAASGLTGWSPMERSARGRDALRV